MNNLIEVKNLVKNFEGRPVLDGVSLGIPPGQITVIMGGSGGGKSTLLRHLIGLLSPDRGEILIDGKNIVGMKEKEMKQIAHWIAAVVTDLKEYQLPADKTQRSAFIKQFKKEVINRPELKKIRQEVTQMAVKFPLFTWEI